MSFGRRSFQAITSTAWAAPELLMVGAAWGQSQRHRGAATGHMSLASSYLGA